MTTKETIIEVIQQISVITNTIISASTQIANVFTESTPIVNIITAFTTCITQSSEALINCFRTVGNITDEDIFEDSLENPESDSGEAVILGSDDYSFLSEETV